MALPTVHTLIRVSRQWQCTRCGLTSYANNRGQADTFMGACVSQSADGTETIKLETVAQRRVQEAIEASEQDASITPRQASFLRQLIREGRTGKGSQSNYSIDPADIPNLTKSMASAIIADALES